MEFLQNISVKKEKRYDIIYKRKRKERVFSVILPDSGNFRIDSAGPERRKSTEKEE